ncbi:hypothetical protein H5V43_21925 (plasmid) [Sphingobium fuliginis]|jgi:hypothetical protein|uniref:Uncharacterized protein n=1 Tax=Sphingobium fuliginis (strain ATCC 27551) TaxID=336203 RepID=A0A7M2GR57_SPHSA|nr:MULTISPECIES: hypothetical protein [Sphingobium]QOT74532.1 hypothetical protein H5V43_21925 [Sphingobium fuliginis]
MTLARFHPQAWVNDYAISVAPEGETEWDIGEVAPNFISDTYETDEFRDHPNAPQWVQNWNGLFYIEILYEN